LAFSGEPAAAAATGRPRAVFPPPPVAHSHPI
jgi:hypothetical protein